MSDSLRNALTELWAYEQQRPAIVTAGTEALTRLLPIALRFTGQGEVVGRFLLGLYNGPEHRFDLTDLRRLDLAVFEDCMSVLAMDFLPEVEVHKRIPNTDSVWHQLHRQWGQREVRP
ncbi:hypothetical protein ACJ6X8_22540 [Pseudomonas alvandae]|uniref:DUF7673 family protein n=1 Tax=Pseudomonas TaxID=286 RepID=UPI00389AE7F5